MCLRISSSRPKSLPPRFSGGRAQRDGSYHGQNHHPRQVQLRDDGQRQRRLARAGAAGDADDAGVGPGRGVGGPTAAGRLRGFQAWCWFLGHPDVLVSLLLTIQSGLTWRVDLMGCVELLKRSRWYTNSPPSWSRRHSERRDS